MKQWSYRIYMNIWSLHWTISCPAADIWQVRSVAERGADGNREISSRPWLEMNTLHVTVQVSVFRSDGIASNFEGKIPVFRDERVRWCWAMLARLKSTSCLFEIKGRLSSANRDTRSWTSERLGRPLFSYPQVMGMMLVATSRVLKLVEIPSLVGNFAVAVSCSHLGAARRVDCHSLLWFWTMVCFSSHETSRLTRGRSVSV